MENIFTVAKPFIIFIKALGLFPMSFHGPARKGSLKIHHKDVIFSCFLFFVSFFVILKGFSTMKWFKENSELTNTAWTVMISLDLMSFFILFIYQIFKLKEIVKFLNLIQKIDSEVKIVTPIKFLLKQFLLTDIPVSFYLEQQKI